MPDRYRKKPVEIEAVQLRWTTWSEVCELLGAALLDVNPDGAREITAEEASDTCGEVGPMYIALDVRTVHGEIATVRHGDWIIPDGKPGTFYPCKPDIFEATYEPRRERDMILDGIDLRVSRAFHKANERGVKLDAMTVDELTRIVMHAVRGDTE